MSYPVRCDGCGEIAKEPTSYDNGSKTADYCKQCERLRQTYDIHVANHKHYLLKEKADERVSNGS